MAPGEVMTRRRPGAQGRGRLRPARAADRLRGHARHRHRRLAAADARAGGGVAARRASCATPQPAARRSRRCSAAASIPAAVEYLDGATLAIAGARSRASVPDGAGFLVAAEVDGSRAEAEHAAARAREALAREALGFYAPETPAEIAELWRWRGGIGFAIFAQKGGALSEDIAVPLDRLQEAVEETFAIGARHGVEALSFGPRRRRQRPFDLPLRARRRRRVAARAGRLRGHLRAGDPPRRHGHRRARDRPAEARPARAPVAAGVGRATPQGQGGIRPEGPANPGKKL